MANTQAKYPHHDLIQAYLNGETIQIRISDNVWSDLGALNTRMNMPSFTVSNIYRKKPTKKEGWVNIYPADHLGIAETSKGDGFLGTIYASRAEADRLAGLRRIDCIKIEWEQS